MGRERSPADLARRWLDSVLSSEGFLRTYPQYAAVVSGLTPVADPSVPLLGLSLHPGPGGSARYYLHLNVPGLQEQPDFAKGLLLHEVHHLVLGHLANPKFRDPEHPKLMELAMELSANEHIREPLPDPILLEHFGRFGIKNGQSTMARYEALLEVEPRGVKPRPGTDWVDDHSWKDRSAPPAGAVQATASLIQRAVDAPVEGAPRLLAGRTPKTLLLQLGLTPEGPARLDWANALQSFLAQRRAPARSYARPNRRFPGRVGAIPGRSYRLRPALRPTLLVALDTSLSMTPDELGDAARELREIADLAHVLIAECDVEVKRTYRFAGRLDRVQGRGGTDLRPALDPSFLRRHYVDGVIYFTDGQGPAPERPPPVPVLWVLTKPDAFGCPWGERARLRR